MNRTIAIALLTACLITTHSMACGADGNGNNGANNANGQKAQNGRAQNGQKAAAARPVNGAGQKKVEADERGAVAGGAVNKDGAKQAAAGNGANNGSCPN